MLYSYRNQEPKPIPFRITLSNGLTRTDPATFTDEEIADAGYVAAPKPPEAGENQVVIWDGVAMQWSVRDLTPDELAARLAAKRESMIVTPRQARLALLGAGKLADIETAIAALDEPTKAAVQIEWEYAVSIERTSSWVVAMTQALGMTDAEVDQLFEQAATI